MGHGLIKGVSAIPCSLESAELGARPVPPVVSSQVHTPFQTYSVEVKFHTLIPRRKNYIREICPPHTHICTHM